MNLHTILHESVLYLEWIAMLFGLIFLKKYWKAPVRLVPLYLICVVTIEYIAFDLSNDQWLYNLLGILELLIFSYVFYSSVKGIGSKKIILAACFCGILFLLVDIFFITKTFFTFLSYAFGIISLALSLMCFVYLFEMTRSEKVLHQNRVLLYWIVIGLLTFHLCNLPVTVLTNQLLEIGNVQNILEIQNVAGIAMYICFIIGFIWTQERYNTQYL